VPANACGFLRHQHATQLSVNNLLRKGVSMTNSQKSYRIWWLCLAVAVAMLCAGNSRAAEKESSATGKLGSLTCKQIPGTGVNLLVYSRSEVRCVFSGGGGIKQWYFGKTGVALGLDLKFNKKETIYLGVVSTTQDFVPEGAFLAGKFGGAKADATLGVGGGAAVLLGGSNNTIALQPAVSASKGVGVAAGLSYLTLDPDPLNEARTVTPLGTLFGQALYASYFDVAYDYYHQSNYAASDYFSRRAIAAAVDPSIPPEATTKWDIIAADKKIVDALRHRVNVALENPTGKILDAAKAQVNFDCWIYALGNKVAGKNAGKCHAALLSNLNNVETAVAERVSEKTLMQPSWFRALFATDSAKLHAASRNTIDNVLHRLAQLENAKVYVMGNTDQVGTAKYNLTLSEKRAQTVTAELLASGVPKAWITPVVFGKHNPAKISKNPNNALNRRVDVLIEPIKIKPEVIKSESGKYLRQ
jgi:outer membrane protein OmpA-like peptidoglycan-associated protein